MFGNYNGCGTESTILHSAHLRFWLPITVCRWMNSDHDHWLIFYMQAIYACHVARRHSINHTDQWPVDSIQPLQHSIHHHVSACSRPVLVSDWQLDGIKGGKFTMSLDPTGSKMTCLVWVLLKVQQNWPEKRERKYELLRSIICV